MEIFNYYLAREIGQTMPLSVITKCNKINLNAGEIHRITDRIFGIRRFGLSNLSILISTFLVILRHRSKIAVIHLPCTSQTGFYGLLLPLMRKVLKINYIIVFHGGGMRPWGFLFLNKILFRNADQIIGVSAPIQKEYEQRTGRSVEIILPLIPFKASIQSKHDLRLKYGFNEKDKIFLMLGSIKPLKGNMLVYEAFKKNDMNEIVDLSIKLLFVGEGEDRKYLENVIVRDGMAEYVKVIPAVPNEQVNEFYRMADFYIIASEFEGTPKTLLEAMFNGLPIIGRDTIGINSILINENNALLFRDGPDLKTAMKRFIFQPQLATQLGESARTIFNEKYSFTNSIRAFHAVYNKYL